MMISLSERDAYLDYAAGYGYYATLRLMLLKQKLQSFRLQSPIFLTIAVFDSGLRPDCLLDWPLT